MRSKKIVKIAAAAVISFVLLLFLISVTAEPVVNSASVKSRIERFISEKIGIGERIEGRIEIGFIPVFSLAVNDASVNMPYGRIASADRIEARPHLLELLQQNVQLEKVAVRGIRIILNKAALASWEQKSKVSSAYKPFRSLNVESFEISNASFHYTDNETKIRDNVNDLKVRIEMPLVDPGKLLKEFGHEGIIEGKIQVKGEFDARSESIDKMPGNTNGYLSIKGKNLHLEGVDLEKALDEYEKIQGFGLNDLFATIYLGPLGGILSQGYTQLSAIRKIMAAKGSSTIQQVVSDWDVVAGTARARDVAFSTKRHRVAVKGELDIPDRRFENLTIAIVDPATNSGSKFPR